MLIISHRINCKQDLINTPERFGVEIDIRSINGRLVLQHDPFKNGELLEDWLPYYKHQYIVLNVKEEGLEESLISLMKQYQVKDYFFLDQSFPFLVRYSKVGHRKSAVRVSEYESILTALSLSGKVEWIWVDYFSKFPLTVIEAQALTQAGFKLCLVSPELHGLDSEVETRKLQSVLERASIPIDAVCTKRPDLWEGFE